MEYVVLLFLTLVFACQSLFCKLYTDSYKGPDKSAASPVYSIFYGILIGIATIAINGFAYQPSWPTVVCGLINAAMLLTYNISMVNAGSRGSYDFMMICMLSGGMLVPIFWNAIFENQPLTLVQIIALVLLMASFILMNLKGLGERGTKTYYLWCLSLFFSNGFYGVLMNVQQAMMNGAQREEMITTTYFVMGLAALVIALRGGKKKFVDGFRMGKKALVCALLACVAATVAANIYVAMIAKMSDRLTLLYAFNNGGVLVVSALLSAVLFQEKLLPPRLAGILCACGGIVLLCL